MGKLYIVATPIGNLEDITLRAIRILLAVPIIVCEDTRRTGILIKKLEETHGRTQHEYISVRDWNEKNQLDYVFSKLISQDVALVSDAGTPLLSDPGYKLVRAAIERGIQVIPIPGPFAGATALSAAGLPSDKFMFWGFLKKGQIPDLETGVTHIFYESPERIGDLITNFRNKYPQAEAVAGVEMTKMFEKFYRGEELLSLVGKKIKGEVTLLVRREEVKPEENRSGPGHS